MNKIFKILATIYLMISPILTCYIVDWFVHKYSRYTPYETMKIGSSLVPGATIIALMIAVLCLAKLWIPHGTQED